MKKRWIQKSVCNGYVIIVEFDDPEQNYYACFTNMWHAINYMNK